MYKNIYGISGIFVLDYICPNWLEFIHTVHCIVISKMMDHSAYSVRFQDCRFHIFRYDEKSTKMEEMGVCGGGKGVRGTS